MIEHMEMILEISKVWGPVVVLGTIGYFFMDKKDQRAADMLTAKDMRAEETIKSIVKSHREDWKAQQDKTEAHIRDMSRDYKDNLTRVQNIADSRDEKLVAALNEIKVEIARGK